MAWLRRKTKDVATTRVCPACKIAGLVQLAPGELCATCQTQHAWDTVGQEPLVVDRNSIAAAIRRRQGEVIPAWRRVLAWIPPLIWLALAGFATWSIYELLSSRQIAPLRVLIDQLETGVDRTFWIGLGTMLAGLIAFRSVRRSRHHQRIGFVAIHALAVVAGATAAVIGGVHKLALREGFGGEYRAMPTREISTLAPHIERILAATVVVLAPDGDGDSRSPAMGTGIVIGGLPDRAWIVTCSHVAMPYAAVGSWRDPAQAQPVWVQLADGREGRATVRWAARPPLDIAVLELPMVAPPLPVPISADASAMQPGTYVMFVPNPFRSGWKVEQGTLLTRDRHVTPAGTYDLLITSLPVIPGDSGSGLFDGRGQLVGLNTWTKLENGLAHGISLPAETMQTLVTEMTRVELATPQE